MLRNAPLVMTRLSAATPAAAARRAPDHSGWWTRRGG